MSRQLKNRSAVQKTLFALEHHAKPLKEVASVITMYLAASTTWEPDSSRGGANSWYISGPGGQRIEIRLRWDPIRLVISDGTVLTPTSRVKAISWCEKVLT